MRWFLMALKPWTDFTDTQIRRIVYYMTYDIYHNWDKNIFSELNN